MGTWISDNLLPSMFIAADSSTEGSPTAVVASSTSWAVDAVVLGIDGLDNLLALLVFIAADSGTAGSPTAAVASSTSCAAVVLGIDGSDNLLASSVFIVADSGTAGSCTSDIGTSTSFSVGMFANVTKDQRRNAECLSMSLVPVSADSSAQRQFRSTQ